MVYIRWLRTRSGPHSDPGPDDDGYLVSFGRALRETHNAPGRTGLCAPTLCIDTTYQPNIILLSPSDTIRSNRRRRSHVPSIVPSASENGPYAEEPRQRQQQFLRQPSQRLETSFETVPGQQRQLSAADHQVGQGEPEQALEEPGESVHGRTRPPSDRRCQGTRPERGQRDAGERRERKTHGGGLLQSDGGRGRQIATLAHGGRPLTTLDDRALGLTIRGAGVDVGEGNS